MNLWFGALAGCLAVTVTYPTDFLRRRTQVKIFEGSYISYIYNFLLNKIEFM